MAEETMITKQSSVEVSRNAKGEVSWKIKLYYDEEVATQEEVAKYMKNMEYHITKELKNGN